MIKDYQAFIAHLKRTGRMKLLPQVLRELRREAPHAKRLASWTETSKENPSLISGWRKIEDGMLTDNTGKSALIDIYKKTTAK